MITKRWSRGLKLLLVVLDHHEGVVLRLLFTVTTVCSNELRQSSSSQTMTSFILDRSDALTVASVPNSM